MILPRFRRRCIDVPWKNQGVFLACCPRTIQGLLKRANQRQRCFRPPETCFVPSIPFFPRSSPNLPTYPPSSSSFLRPSPKSKMFPVSASVNGPTLLSTPRLSSPHGVSHRNPIQSGIPTGNRSSIPNGALIQYLGAIGGVENASF
jgi:hypothetical protein